MRILFTAFVPRVIIPSAFAVANDQLHVYYGCTDSTTNVATAPLSEVFDALS